ncbi:MAG: hypothetical protein MMC33_009091 [Icmadophila ericetorum]|nr:hypothetical protein [Icmadophila ericetorum]
MFLLNMYAAWSFDYPEHLPWNAPGLPRKPYQALAIFTSFIGKYLFLSVAGAIASFAFLYGRDDYSPEERILFAHLALLWLLVVQGLDRADRHEREISKIPRGKTAEAIQRKQDPDNTLTCLRILLTISMAGAITGAYLFAEIEN